MEEVTKCRYIDCVDTREKEQILHELPVCDTGLCVRWLINSGHVDLIGRDLDALRSMKFFICNNHFTDDCYLSKGTLKENAVPFPHWSAVSKTLKSLRTRRKVQTNGQGSSMEEASINQSVEKNAPSEFDVDQWCRTCATKKQNLVSMTSKGKGTDMSLLSKLKLLIEIDDEDALPTKMCDECVDKLEQSFKFFQQIYVADNTLRHVFPNSRSNNIPRKPLYSLSDHMRKEQRDKEEKEKKKDTDKEKEEEQRQQQQDRAPRVTRGIFRRGRGRPRSRGFGGRGRGRQRSAQVAMSIQNPIANASPSSSSGNNIIIRQIYESRTNESVTSRNESQGEEHEDERQGDTVFSLLTDTCRSDEELDWSDVLKVMSHQTYHGSRKDKFIESETRLDEKIDIKIETTVEPIVEENIDTKEEVGEEKEKEREQDKEKQKEEDEKTVEQLVELKAETTMKMETEWTEVLVEEQRRIQDIKGETEAEGEVKIKMITDRNRIETIHCEFCNQEFKFKQELHTHLLTDHSQLSGHICTNCLVCYKSESLLLNHCDSCHEERKYRCEHCQEEFVEKRVLKEHISKCQLEEKSHYSCDSCGLTLDRKEKLAEHVKNHSESSVVTLQSEMEDKSKKVEKETISSPTTYQMSKVDQQSAVAGASSSRIVTCESNMDNKDNAKIPTDRLEINTSEHAQAEGKTMTCPDCNEQMQNTLELSIHRMRRHSVNRKDAMCLLCDNKSFCSTEEYKQHILDHCKRLRISPR